MSRISIFSALAAAMFGVLAMAGQAPAQEVPNIIAGSNGEAEVTFRSNNCVVYYNANGMRRNSLPACRADQVTAADRGVAGYRREQGLSSMSSGNAPPTVNVGETGFGSVSFSDGCVVNYRQDGSRHNTNNRCVRDQVRRADEAMAGYRREQGMMGQGHHGGGMGPPEVSMNEMTGYGTVRFHDGCVVSYRADGTRMTTGSRCNRDQTRHADDAMARHRREQGMFTGTSVPRVVTLRNGTVQMLYANPFCAVYFNDKGIRTSSTKDCTNRQRLDSALRIIVHRREQGSN